METYQEINSIGKIVRIGTAEDGDIFCKIQFDGIRLSITGVEGPKDNGDAAGRCGQIVMSLNPKNIEPAPGWNRDRIRRFLKIWGRWHLNDMCAGNPEQERTLRQHKISGSIGHYDWACGVLKNAGILVSDGYKYGSGWMTEEIPQTILEELAALPDSDKPPAWV